MWSGCRAKTDWRRAVKMAHVLGGPQQWDRREAAGTSVRLMEVRQ